MNKKLLGLLIAGSALAIAIPLSLTTVKSNVTHAELEDTDNSSSDIALGDIFEELPAFNQSEVMADNSSSMDGFSETQTPTDSSDSMSEDIPSPEVVAINPESDLATPTNTDTSAQSEEAVLSADDSTISPVSPQIVPTKVGTNSTQLPTDISTIFDMTPDATASGLPTEDPRRQKIISIAMSQVGSVRAKAAGEPDETGRATRVGWQQLKQYFDLAAPGSWSDETIKYHKQPGLPAWCGIFALWTLKEAGIDVGNWQPTKGISSVKNIRTTSNPQPGDIAYTEFDQKGERVQHHAIVWKIEGNTVYTIDGNSSTQSEVTGPNSKSRQAFTAFYTAF
jgi:CHAP domain